jgi:hypothetical protein
MDRRVCRKSRRRGWRVSTYTSPPVAAAGRLEATCGWHVLPSRAGACWARWPALALEPSLSSGCKPPHASRSASSLSARGTIIAITKPCSGRQGLEGLERRRDHRGGARRGGDRRGRADESARCGQRSFDTRSELIERFGRLLRENVASRAIPREKAWLQAIVDRVEAEMNVIRIVADKTNLDTALARSGGVVTPGVRCSVRKWRARKDSNL